MQWVQEAVEASESCRAHEVALTLGLQTLSHGKILVDLGVGSEGCLSDRASRVVTGLQLSSAFCRQTHTHKKNKQPKQAQKHSSG